MNIAIHSKQKIKLFISFLPDMDFEGAEVRLPGGAAAESSAGSSVSDRVRRALAKHHEDKARQIPAAMRQQQDSPVRATFTPGTAEPARRSRAVSMIKGKLSDTTADFLMNTFGGFCLNLDGLMGRGDE